MASPGEIESGFRLGADAVEAVVDGGTFDRLALLGRDKVGSSGQALGQLGKPITSEDLLDGGKIGGGKEAPEVKTGKPLGGSGPKKGGSTDALGTPITSETRAGELSGSGVPINEATSAAAADQAVLEMPAWERGPAIQTAAAQGIGIPTNEAIRAADDTSPMVRGMQEAKNAGGDTLLGTGVPVMPGTRAAAQLSGLPTSAGKNALVNAIRNAGRPGV